MGKQSKIGKNPLDEIDETDPLGAFLNTTSNNKNSAAQKPPKKASRPKIEIAKVVEPDEDVPEPSLPKQRMTITLSVEAIEKARDAVYWTPGYSLNQLGEEAILARIAELEEGRGEPFPERKAQLRVGRTVGS